MITIWKRIPLLRFALFFILGNLIAKYISISSKSHIFLLLFIVLLSIIVFILHEKKQRRAQKFYGIIIIFICLLCGIANPPTSSNNIDLNTDYTYYSAIVTSKAKEKEKYYQIDVLLEITDSNKKSFSSNKKKAIISLEKNDSAPPQIGDRIIFYSKINRIIPNNNPSAFDYNRYLNGKEIFYKSWVPKNKWKIASNTSKFKLKRFSENTRTTLISILEEGGLSDKELSIASALMLGEKSLLEPETKKAFSSAGAMHILCVSGLHVGIVFMLLSSLIRVPKNFKRLIFFKEIFILISIWAFAMLSGFSPSVCRSALMFSIMIFARLLKRKNINWNTILASAIILIAIDSELLYSPGAQLSYLAVCGIIAMQPEIYKLYKPKTILGEKIWALMCVSISAQLFTMPISLGLFHTFPNYFLLTNIIVVPMSTVILYLCIFTFILSKIPFLGAFIAKLLALSLKILYLSVEWIEKLPFSVSENIYTANFSGFFLLVAALFLYLYLVKFDKKKLVVSLMAVLCFSIINIVAYNTKTSKNQLVIFSNYSGFIISNKQNTNCDWYIDSANNKNDWLISNTLTNYNADNKIKYSNVNIRKNNFYLSNSKFSMLIINKRIYDYSNYTKGSNKLILCSNEYTDYQKLIDSNNISSIIIALRLKNYQKEILDSICESKNIDVYDINVEGAYMLDY